MNSARDATDKKHVVYILRMWRAGTADSAWYASLENPHRGERIGFENLERLFAFLMQGTERSSKQQPGDKDGNLYTSTCDHSDE